MTDFAVLRILLLEDEEDDATLVSRELARAGIDCELVRARTGSEYRQALADRPPDLILSDNRLQDYSGLAALRFARERLPEVPFVFVSGTIGEEAAIEAMREGATDYVLKDRLARLGPVVQRVRDDLALRRELAAMRSQYLNAAKLEAMGRMAGAVAHDFRNILTIMMGHAELLLLRVPEPDPVRERLRTILDAGQRGVDLAAQLMTFGRQSPESVTEFNPVAEARRTEAMFRSVLTRGIRLTIAADPTAGLVRGDPGQFGQILLNLLVNARDAMPDGGHVTLGVRGCTLAVPATFVASAAPAGEYVEVAVTDTGCGMSDAVRQRIFEPYFTTKPADRGTGLGLAIVFNLVRNAGGHLEVESAPGAGTTFRMLFPRAMSRPDGAGAAGAAGRRVLVAEDDGALRQQIRQMLELAGFDVLVAADGVDALELAGRVSGGIAVLLTDVHMPRMDGALLAGTFAASWPRTRILVMTGSEGYGTKTPTTWPVLRKPFRPSDLLARVQEVLRPES